MKILKEDDPKMIRMGSKREFEKQKTPLVSFFLGLTKACTITTTFKNKKN